MTISDSSVFILELGSGATGPRCNAPYIATGMHWRKTPSRQNAMYFPQKVSSRFGQGLATSFGRFSDLVQKTSIKGVCQEETTIGGTNLQKVRNKHFPTPLQVRM